MVTKLSILICLNLRGPKVLMPELGHYRGTAFNGVYVGVFLLESSCTRFTCSVYYHWRFEVKLGFWL